MASSARLFCCRMADTFHLRVKRLSRQCLDTVEPWAWLSLLYFRSHGASGEEDRRPVGTGPTAVSSRGL